MLIIYDNICYIALDGRLKESIVDTSSMFIEGMVVIFEVFEAKFIKAGDRKDGGRDNIGVNISSGSSVLVVSLSSHFGSSRDSDRGASIGDSEGEFFDRRSFVFA